MTSTLNRCVTGDAVYLYDRGLTGEVVATSTLGLPYAPVVKLADGGRVFYCGENLKDCCHHAPVFLKTLRDLNFSKEDIDHFLQAWFSTNRETQRPVFFEGLQAALKTNDKDTIANFIGELRKTITF